MNFFDDQKYWEKYVEAHGGNIYESVVHIAKCARGLEIGVNNVISHSDAITWELTNQPPKDLKKRLKIHEDRKTSYKREIDDELSQIDDIETREAVDNSCRLSMINKYICFDYGQITDKYIQSRVRILTRMILKDKPFKEGIQMGDTNMVVPKLEVEASEQPKKRRGRPPKSASADLQKTEAPKTESTKKTEAKKTETKKAQPDDKVKADVKEKAEVKVDTKPKSEPKETKAVEPKTEQKSTKEAKTSEPKETKPAKTETKSKVEESKKTETPKTEPKASKDKEQPKAETEDTADDVDKLKSELGIAEPLKAPDKKSDEGNDHVGETLLLTHPLVVYRGPSRVAPMKQFQGYITILGDFDKEFVYVKFTRPGVGVQQGYMIIPDAIKSTLS